MGFFPYQFPFEFGDEEASASSSGTPTGPYGPAVDPETGDLVISAGQLVMVDGIDLIGQLVRTRLALFQGEYLPDAQEGMPYFQSILVKGTNPNIIRGAFVNRILSTPGIQSITSLSLNINPDTRNLAVAFQVVADVGLLVDQFELPLTPTPAGS